MPHVRVGHTLQDSTVHYNLNEVTWTMQDNPQFIDPNRRYRFVPDGINLLGISKAQAYLRVKAGAIKTFKEGRSTFIHGSELIRASRPPEEADKAA